MGRNTDLYNKREGEGERHPYDREKETETGP
jgi:hypothetical protein